MRVVPFVSSSEVAGADGWRNGEKQALGLVDFV